MPYLEIYFVDRQRFGTTGVNVSAHLRGGTPSATRSMGIVLSQV